MQQGNAQTKTDEVSADPVVLPNTLLSAYAVLARRLQGAAAGTELRAYVPPQSELPLRVTAVTQERIETPKGTINVTRYGLVLATPPPGGDLARLYTPAGLVPVDGRWMWNPLVLARRDAMTTRPPVRVALAGMLLRLARHVPLPFTLIQCLLDQQPDEISLTHRPP